MLWTLPNILTWIRIAAIPLIVILFYAPYHWSDPAAGLLFAAAGITDSLDGHLARNRDASGPEKRPEEHKTELQSQSKIVCSVVLVKEKNYATHTRNKT